MDAKPYQADTPVVLTLYQGVKQGTVASLDDLIGTFDDDYFVGLRAMRFTGTSIRASSEALPYGRHRASTICTFVGPGRPSADLKQIHHWPLCAAAWVLC